MGETYRNAGVDIEGGDSFARHIANIASPAVSRGIGGFAGAFEPDLSGMKHPVLLSSTDGVGTKIMVARELGDYSTIGIDLVAMCVNDLAVCGAQPAVFLDYIACGKVDRERLDVLIDGIIKGCEQAGCILAGGETAEMPGVYGESDIDIAGFCTGFVDRDDMLPRKEAIREGDVILGIPSNGIHSNGLSLARRIIPPSDSSRFRELLLPTRIYVRELMSLAGSGLLLGAAHITGGGLEGNISRILPPGLTPKLNFQWEIPEIFTYIREKGPVDSEEMLKVFNMGIGIALVVRPGDVSAIRNTAKELETSIIDIGTVVHG